MTDYAPERSLDLATPNSNRRNAVEYDPSLPYQGQGVAEQASAPWRKAEKQIGDLQQHANLVLNSMVDAKSTELNNEVNAAYLKMKVDYSQLQEGAAADQYLDFLKQVSEVRNQYLDAAKDPAVRRALAAKTVDAGNSTQAFMYQHMTNEVAKAQDNAHLAAMSQIGQGLMMDWADPNQRAQHFADLDKEMGYFYAKRGVDPNSQEAKDMRMKAMSTAVGNAIDYEIATNRVGSAQVDLNRFKGQIDMKTWASLAEKLLNKQRQNAVHAQQMAALQEQQRLTALQYQNAMLEKMSKPMDAQQMLAFRTDKNNIRLAREAAIKKLMLTADKDQAKAWFGKGGDLSDPANFKGDPKILQDETEHQMELMLIDTNLARKNLYDQSVIAQNAIGYEVNALLKNAQEQKAKIDVSNLLGKLSPEAQGALLMLAGRQTGVYTLSDARTREAANKILEDFSYKGNGNYDLFYQTSTKTQEEMEFDPHFQNDAQFNAFVSTNGFSLSQREKLMDLYAKFKNAKGEAGYKKFLSTYEAMAGNVFNGKDRDLFTALYGSKADKAGLDFQDIALAYDMKNRLHDKFTEALAEYNNAHGTHFNPANITLPVMTKIMNDITPEINSYYDEQKTVYETALNDENRKDFIDYIRDNYKTLKDVDDATLIKFYNYEIAEQLNGNGTKLDVAKAYSEAANKLMQGAR